MSRETEYTGLEIAVIGMSGRFPGAKNIEEFWNNLKDGVESITFFSHQELEEAGVEKEQLENPNYVKASGVLADIDKFDAGFFDYTPMEAETMNPQLRLFHEGAWEALEDAGYVPDSYNGLIGLYAGATDSFYWKILTILSGKEDHLGSFEADKLTNRDYLCARVAYKLNLKGPVVFMHTACSTSLIAIHMSCQGLLSGECDLALAGGVSIIPYKAGYIYQEGMIFSPDGRCRAFDSSAKGTLVGSGLGIVVLKRLEEAIEDRDHINAVIKGSSINNDGMQKVGFAAPSVEGQSEVIKDAIRTAQIEVESIGCIETHGTGTILGDPIEFEALKNAFDTDKKSFCAIGSVKTNFGHLDAAAGVVGFIKTILALQHQLIPPSLHFEIPNQRIDLINSPFYVSTSLREWENSRYPRRAGVSSMGIGGTNAHVILEEAPANHRDKEGTRGLAPLSNRHYQLILLSAKTETALEQMTQNLAEYLKNNPDINLADAAYTLQVGRKDFKYRRMEVSSTANEAIDLLSISSMPDAERIRELTAKDKNRQWVFVFPQGPGYENMGRELYQTQPIFREEMGRCFRILTPLMDCDAKEMYYSSTTCNWHISLFTFEYALAILLMKWGIEPDAMIGEGVGEYVAAAISETFSLENALELIVYRSQLMEKLPPVYSAIPEALVKEFEKKIKEIPLNKPKIPYISNMTGNWLHQEDALNPVYWCRQLDKTEGHISEKEIMELVKEKNSIFVQIGPDSGILKKFNINSINLVREDGRMISEENYLLNGIGQLWIYGKKIDWNEFYFERKRKRISLPTYPFERHRYWIEGNPFKIGVEMLAKESQINQVKKETGIQEWLYQPSWKRAAAPAGKQGEINRQLCWLVFINTCRLGEQLVKQLTQQGQVVITVKSGSNYLKENDRQYTVNPGQEDDYNQLFKELERMNMIPEQVVHSWMVRAANNKMTERERLLNARELGFYSLINIARGIGKQDINKKIQVTVISNNMQEVIGEDGRCPEKAILLGPVKTIPKEYNNIYCRSIDIVLPENGSKQEKKLIGQLLDEFTAGSLEPVAAYRGCYRWVQKFEPVRLENSKKESPRLRKKGVYLVTGGLAGIGLALAQYLAREVRAKLILTGRTEIPAKDRWEQYLENAAEDDTVGMKIREIKELEESGAEVLVFSADVTNLEQMRELVRRAGEQLGPIHGVIHSAGLPDGAMIRLRTRETSESVLKAKIEGTLVLNCLLQDMDTDFFILCSSLNSIMSQVGQVAYCSGNSFLDAFAHYRTVMDGALTISINWDRWQNTGMARIAEAQHKELTGKELLGGIKVDEGVELFRRILADPLPQAVVSIRHLETLIQQSNTFKADSLIEVIEVNTVSNKKTFPRPALASPYAAPVNDIQQKLANMWANFFGFERVGIDDNFFELGGDSLKIIIMISKMHKEFNTKISLNDFFENPVIKKLEKLIAQGDAGDCFIAIEPVEKKEYYTLSTIQKRLYIIQQLELKNTAYNLPQLMVLPGEIDMMKLEETLRKLIKRHESFRTSFELIDGEPVQKIHDEADHEIEYYDLQVKGAGSTGEKTFEPKSRELRAKSYISSFIRHFDLSLAPLFRVGVIKPAKAKYLLIVDIHHIVTDAFSHGILEQDFLRLYNGNGLPAMRLQYKDYSEWQHSNQYHKLTRQQEKYWHDIFAHELPVLNLPTDYQRPHRQSFEGTTVSFILDKKETKALKKIVMENEVTLYMVLLAVFKVLLSRLSGKEDIIVGTAVAARRHPDLEKIVGMFANTLAIRSYPLGKHTFKHFLMQIKEITIKSFENQDYSFENLVEQVKGNLNRDMSRNPLFDVMFSHQNAEADTYPGEIPGTIGTHPEMEANTSLLKGAKFDLTFYTKDNGESIPCWFEYCTRLFKEDTIKRFINYFKEVISAVTENKEIKLKDIKLSSDLLMPQANMPQISFDF